MNSQNLISPKTSIMKYLSLKTFIIILFLTVTLAGYGQDELAGHEQEGQDGQVENADDKPTVDVGADLVSLYVWRGMYQGGISIQPALSLSIYGITVGAWGSAGFPEFAKEVDFYLSYEWKGFTATLSDYWWKGEGTSYFRDGSSHHLEAGLGFTFSEKFPLSLEVNTMLSGDEDRDDDDRKYYSTYIAAGFPFSVGTIACEAGIGITPYKGMYYKKFAVTNISVKATKSLQLSSTYEMPVFVELIFSPAQDNAFFVFGIQF